MILGVVKPSFESIATEKLWSFFIINSFIKPSESISGLTVELIIGYSSMANDIALIKKGSKVNPSIWAFASYLINNKFVAFISSENVNVGIDNACVIVFVIAFFIPTIFFIWSYGLCFCSFTCSI